MVNMSAKEFLKLRTTTSFILTIPFFPNVSLCSQISKSFMCKQTTSPISLNLVDVRIKGCYTELQQLCPIFQTADEELTWDQEVWEGESHCFASSRKRLVKSFIRCCCCYCCPQSLTVSVSDANTRGARRKRQKREWVREWRKKKTLRTKGPCSGDWCPMKWR